MNQEKLSIATGILSDMINKENKIHAISVFSLFNPLTQEATIWLKIGGVDGAEDMAFNSPQNEETYTHWTDGNQVIMLFDANKLSLEQIKNIYMEHYYAIHMNKAQ